MSQLWGHGVLTFGNIQSTKTSGPDKCKGPRPSRHLMINGSEWLNEWWLIKTRTHTHLGEDDSHGEVLTVRCHVSQHHDARQSLTSATIAQTVDHSSQTTTVYNQLGQLEPHTIANDLMTCRVFLCLCLCLCELPQACVSPPPSSGWWRSCGRTRPDPWGRSAPRETHRLPSPSLPGPPSVCWSDWEPKTPASRGRQTHTA